MVSQDDDRQLVFFRQIKGFYRYPEGILNSGRSQDRPREFPMVGMEHELEVALLGSGGQADGGTGRCPSTTTIGVSVIPASPSPSTIRQKPLPEVAVIARTPA